MHAGIGATGALHHTLFARQRLDRRGQHALYGNLVSLDLPTAKRRAIIFNGALVARHY
jgi:hypothetical protein